MKKCSLYGQTRSQRNKKMNNFIAFLARAQAFSFSWLSSVTVLQSKRDKNNCSKSSFVQTSSLNGGKFFYCAGMWLIMVIELSGEQFGLKSYA